MSIVHLGLDSHGIVNWLFHYYYSPLHMNKKE